ncbi:MAG TPA: hypothetical protein VFT86_01300 [Gaiellaceae bacterium]|nr:hypothetical protein [Gaiellaceae bacterium]
MFFAALRRLVLLALGAVVLTVALSLLFGLLAGGSLNRALVLGFYLAGCFLLICGFFVGNRGPTRVESESPGVVVPFMGIGTRSLRWASLREQNETINNSAVFICLGLVLVLLGIVLDTQQSLV